MPGTGCCALPDSVRLTAQAVKLGCAGVLMLPPFYYKGVPEEGLYRNFSEVIQRVGDERLRLYLYHIPAVSQVPITLGLIERLLKAYPQQVAGIKDSSGDWNNTQARARRLRQVRLRRVRRQRGVPAAEPPRRRRGLHHRGRNVNPHGIDAVYRNWQSAEAPALQAQADGVRKVLQSVPMIPALKAVIAHYAGDAAWATVRPPLVELSAHDRDGLIAALTNLGFDMPGLRVTTVARLGMRTVSEDLGQGGRGAAWVRPGSLRH